MPLDGPIVCLVTDRRRLLDDSGGFEAVRQRLVQVARDAVHAGVDLIQVREHRLETAQLVDLVREIVEIADADVDASRRERSPRRRAGLRRRRRPSASGLLRLQTLSGQWFPKGFSLAGRCIMWTRRANTRPRSTISSPAPFFPRPRSRRRRTGLVSAVSRRLSEPCGCRFWRLAGSPLTGSHRSPPPAPPASPPSVCFFPAWFALARTVDSVRRQFDSARAAF